jgi:putative membrane protein
MPGYGWMGGMFWFWLFPFVLVVVVVVLVLTRGSKPLSRPSEPTPEEILRRRYAAGEISTEEFKERMAVLGGRH